MAIPSPQDVIAHYGTHSPERLAAALGFRVTRTEAPPRLPGVTVLSAFEPRAEIILYLEPLRQAAAARQTSPACLEQWHIAHELYHGLADTTGISAWRVRETEADLWADELLALLGPDACADT